MSVVGESAGDESVRLAAYDPTWPLKFEAEPADLLECIGPWVTGGIHHVGSTAVPALPAKPVIDILIGHITCTSSRRIAPLPGRARLP